MIHSLKLGKLSGEALCFSLLHFLSFSFTFSLAKHPLRMTTQMMSGYNSFLLEIYLLFGKLFVLIGCLMLDPVMFISYHI